jgi:hypothetical protein
MSPVRSGSCILYASVYASCMHPVCIMYASCMHPCGTQVAGLKAPVGKSLEHCGRQVAPADGEGAADGNLRVAVAAFPLRQIRVAAAPEERTFLSHTLTYDPTRSPSCNNGSEALRQRKAHRGAAARLVFHTQPLAVPHAVARRVACPGRKQPTITRTGVQAAATPIYPKALHESNVAWRTLRMLQRPGRARTVVGREPVAHGVGRDVDAHRA